LLCFNVLIDKYNALDYDTKNCLVYIGALLIMSICSISQLQYDEMLLMKISGFDAKGNGFA